MPSHPQPRDPTNSARRWAWRLHYAIVGTVIVSYAIVYREVLFGAQAPTTRSSGGWEILRGIVGGFERMGIVVMMVVLIVYALVSSVVMIWAARRAWVPIVLHGVVFGGVGASEMHQRAARQEEEAAYRASPEYREREQRKQLDTCLVVEAEVHVDGVVGATVTLHNRDCPFDLVVSDVSFAGFYDGGNLLFSDKAWPRREPVIIAPGREHRFEVEEVGAIRSLPTARKWAWRTNVSLDTIAIGIPCFATEGAPEAERCRPMERVSLPRDAP